MGLFKKKKKTMANDNMNNDIAQKNADKLLEICNNYIEQYEAENPKGEISAKKDINVELNKWISEAMDELRTFDDSVDYVKIAHTMLANITFDLLVSGKYHVDHGILVPWNCSPNLMFIYRKSMEYAESIGAVSTEEVEQQFDYLRICINEAEPI